MRKDKGFTLVELLVVFAIVALIMALMPVAFEKLRESADYRAVVSGVISDMRSARQQALLLGRESRFEIDMQKRMYGVVPGKSRELPPSISVRATVAEGDASPEGVFAVRFLPGGGATGGSVEITRPAGNGVKLTVDWLTGSVTQQTLPL